MTVEDLLKPRYLVIADYPSNIDKVGTVYEIDLSDGHGVDFEMTCKKYPHLFRKLEWWEERAIEDMPEYVKQRSDGKVCRITNWHNKIKLFPVGTDSRNIQHASDEVIPITEDEYRAKIINQ